MHYVLLAEHSAEVCPTGNARVREVMTKGAAEIPGLAKKHGVKIIAGPFVNREHIIVIAAEVDRPEALDRFIFESGLEQWNRVRVLPSQTMEEGIKELAATKPIF